MASCQVPTQHGCWAQLWSVLGLLGQLELVISNTGQQHWPLLTEAALAALSLSRPGHRYPMYHFWQQVLHLEDQGQPCHHHLSLCLVSNCPSRTWAWDWHRPDLTPPFLGHKRARASGKVHGNWWHIWLAVALHCQLG